MNTPENKEAVWPRRPKSAMEQLIDAARDNNLQEIKLLLSTADQKAKDQALRWAASEGHIDAMHLLLSGGADVHADNEEALQWAAQAGQLEATQLLIDLGAVIQADRQGALRWASQNGENETVALLLKHGANPTMEGEAGGSAIDTAWKNHPRTTKLLLRYAPDKWIKENLRWKRWESAGKEELDRRARLESKSLRDTGAVLEP